MGGGELQFACAVKSEATRSCSASTAYLVIRSAAKHPMPTQKLVGFEPLSLDPTEENTMHLAIPKTRLALVDSTGALVLYKGAHTAADEFVHPVPAPTV